MHTQYGVRFCLQWPLLRQHAFLLWRSTAFCHCSLYTVAQQVSEGVAQLSKVRSMFSKLQLRIDELRGDVLVMSEGLKTSITELELCKNGLDDFVLKAQDAFSKDLRMVAESLHTLATAVNLRGIQPPVFNTQQVRW